MSFLRRLGLGVIGLFSLYIVCGSTSYGASTAQTEHPIYEFGPLPDGTTPYNGLVADSAGRLYGAAFGGGLFLDGAVFRLTPPSSGAGPWTEEILHNFNYADGDAPLGNLVLDSSGNVYGVAQQGGGYSGSNSLGGGVVYRLSNLPGWPITILHSFPTAGSTQAPGDGSYPAGGVTFGPNGLLYGTTALGGPKGVGTVYSLSPLGDATEYAIIHGFQADSTKGGALPYIGLTTDGADRFYGVTQNGGTSASGAPYSGSGTVFSLTLGSNGQWLERILYNFGSSASGDLQFPNMDGHLVRGLHGVLYGCAGRGPLGGGGIFSLTPPTAGATNWTETILYNFGANPTDPNANGNCGLTQAPSGALIGTTGPGGQYNQGTTFQLTPPAAGQTAWTLQVLHSFGLHAKLGSNPSGPPLRHGTQYYSTTAGTPDGNGTVYEFTP